MVVGEAEEEEGKGKDKVLGDEPPCIVEIQLPDKRQEMKGLLEDRRGEQRGLSVQGQGDILFHVPGYNIAICCLLFSYSFFAILLV